MYIEIYAVYSIPFLSFFLPLYLVIIQFYYTSRVMMKKEHYQTCSSDEIAQRSRSSQYYVSKQRNFSTAMIRKNCVKGIKKMQHHSSRLTGETRDAR
jgi:hypothetical protein